MITIPSSYPLLRAGNLQWKRDLFYILNSLPMRHIPSYSDSNCIKILNFCYELSLPQIQEQKNKISWKTYCQLFFSTVISASSDFATGVRVIMSWTDCKNFNYNSVQKSLKLALCDLCSVLRFYTINCNTLKKVTTKWQRRNKAPVLTLCCLNNHEGRNWRKNFSSLLVKSLCFSKCFSVILIFVN